MITIKYLITYRNRPLHAFGAMGLIFGGFGMLINAYLFITWMMGYGIGGRPLLTLGVLLTIIGIQFISIGLLGEMITNNITRNPDNLIK